MSATAILGNQGGQFTKRITFDGVAQGAVGTVVIGTCVGNGSIIITHIVNHCVVALVSAGGGTISLGSTGNVAALIAATTATTIDTNEFWQDATPELGVGSVLIDRYLVADLTYTVVTAAITAGSIDFTVNWLPNQPNSQLA